MPGMTKTPILKVARPGYDIRTATDANLAFSSNRETPKIFMQTSSSWTNTLGYVPSLMSFRKLNTTNYTHDLQNISSDTDPLQGAYLDENGNLSVSKRTGDVSMYSILYFSPLDKDIPIAYKRKRTPRILIAKKGFTTDTSPANMQIDSEFDTFKIFKTGTLSIVAPAETVPAGSVNKVHTATVNHDLGYPPVYLPMASVGWRLDDPLVNNVSFIVNDYIGLPNNPYLSSDMLDVYVDSSNLYMKLTRFANEFFDRTFLSEITITMYYTIFYNEIGEEFNLLES